MDILMIGGIAYVAVGLLAARGGCFLRACDESMKNMMNNRVAPNGDDGIPHHTIVTKEALS